MSLQVVFSRRSSWAQTLLWLICCASVTVLALGKTALAADFTGPVVSVLDSDTIEVLHNNHAERIRLNGIDCPEKGQAYGNNAKHAASNLVFGKEVTLLTHGLDKYGRTIADVLLPDGTNVNHTLVKDGWCWSKSVQRQTNLVAVERFYRNRSLASF